MDVFGYISSVNKISLVVLALIFLFLLYEIYLFRKDRRKKVIVSVPSFGVTPMQAATPPPAPPPPQKEIPVIKKTRKKIAKKTIGMMVASVLMIIGIGAISFRLSQRSSNNASIAPARPRAAEIPTPTPSPFLPLSSKPTSIINTPAPTEVPPPINVSPTAKAPLLFAKNISLSPTPVVFTTKEEPTPVQQPSPTETLSLSPVPTAALSLPSPTQSIVQNLPESGVAQYSIFIVVLASLLIVGSFLY